MAGLSCLLFAPVSRLRAIVLPAICYEVCAAPSVMRFVVGLVAVEVLAVICTHFVSIGRHWPDKVLATRYFLETREVRETQYL